jgi:hypothetical protein
MGWKSRLKRHVDGGYRLYRLQQTIMISADQSTPATISTSPSTLGAFAGHRSYR